MSNSSINSQLFQAKIGSIQNQADSSSVYSNGQWSFKNSTALTSVTITDSGNVGIGTGAQTPTARLDVRGASNPSIKVWSGGGSSGNYAELMLHSYNSFSGFGQTYIRALSTATGNSATALTFATEDNGFGGPVERMRIDAVGALTVGSSGSTISHTIQAPSNPAGTAAVHVRKQNVAINSGGNSYIEFYGASGGYDGYLGVTGTTLTVIDASDSRKKENVRPANYGLKEIKELKPVVYDWKEEFGGEKDVKGFLAQEVKQVLPECVTIKDETDAGGFSDSHFLGTANMIPVLVAAIQELSAKNDALEARLAALESKP